MDKVTESDKREKMAQTLDLAVGELEAVYNALKYGQPVVSIGMWGRLDYLKKQVKEAVK